MMLKLPLLTKIVGAGVTGLVLIGGTAAGAGPAVNAVLAAGTKPTVTAAAQQAGRRMGIRARRLVIRAEAAALHITLRQLRQDVRSGTSVEQLAANAGMDKAQFTAAVAADLKPMLAKLVSAGRLTQAQANAITGRVQKGWLPLWTLPPRAPRTGSPSPAQSVTS